MSKKDIVMRNIIKGIAEGLFKIGEKLPPERALAEKYGISRIIVHSAIVELHAKGLLVIAPRKGVTVADYKRHGNIDLLEIILTATEDQDNELLEGLLDSRKLLEEEFASLAALNRTDSNLCNLERIIAALQQANDLTTVAHLDFSLHHEIAHATGNVIYPLLIKSMEHTYKRLIKEYYASIDNWGGVVAHHRVLLEAISAKDSVQAKKIMRRLLTEGALSLKQRHGIRQ